MKKCLNLGCGRDYRESTDEEEWWNVDTNPSVRADTYLDLESPCWANSFQKEPDNAYMQVPDEVVQFDLVLIKHVIEHIADLDTFMENLYRVTAPEGKVVILSPYWTHDWAWGDPGHKRAINENTFQFYDKEFLAKEAANEDSP